MDNSIGSNGRLLSAAELGDRNVVKDLLGAANVDVNAKDSDGLTALHWAATEGHVAIVKDLLDAANVDVNAKDDRGRTALNRAARNGHVAIVKDLLGAANVDVNAKDKRGRTALRRAAHNGHVAIVKDLLGAANIEDVNAKDSDGLTALSWAARNGHVAIVKNLLGAANVDVNATNSDGSTALHWAAENGHVAIVKDLLGAANVDVNAKDSNNWTALRRASRKGHVAIVKDVLVAANINVNAKDIDHLSGLHLAAANGHVAVVKDLLNVAEEDVNAKDSDGLTSLHWAAMKGHVAIVEDLLGAANVDANLKTNHNGYSVLHLAVIAADTGVAKILSNNSKVIFTQVDKDGKNPLELAHQLANASNDQRNDVLEAELRGKIGWQEWLRSQLEQGNVSNGQRFVAVEATLVDSKAGKVFMDNLYRDRQVYVDAANAILVGAALIASVTFASWLQPPLNYTDTSYASSSYSPSSLPKYADVEDNVGLGVFWVSNSLSFYFAIGTVVLGACSVLPRRRLFIKEDVMRLRRNLLLTSFLLALSVFCVLIAFGTAGVIVLMPIFKIRLYMIVPTIIGGAVCFLCLAYLVYSILVEIWQKGGRGI